VSTIPATRPEEEGPVRLDERNHGVLGRVFGWMGIQEEEEKFCPL